MRQIKASEVEPGMMVKWKRGKFTHEVLVERVHSSAGGRTIWFVNGVDGLSVHSDTTVTVLAEPQPEEPTKFGARVVAGGYEFLLSNGGLRPWKARLDGNRYSWAEVCGLGPVTIIDANPSWSIPTESTPAVPEKLYVWPENDEHLRGHKWCDNDGDTAQYINGAWRYLWPSGPGAAHAAPLENAPWTRRDV